MFGWGGGSFIALIPVLLANWLGVSRLPQALGMCYSAQATTLLLGPPLVGWLYDGLGSYKVALVIVGCCEFISAAAMCLIPRLVREQVRARGTGSQPAPPAPTHTPVQPCVQQIAACILLNHQLCASHARPCRRPTIKQLLQENGMAK